MITRPYTNFILNYGTHPNNLIEANSCPERFIGKDHVGELVSISEKCHTSRLQRSGIGFLGRISEQSTNKPQLWLRGICLNTSPEWTVVKKQLQRD